MEMGEVAKNNNNNNNNRVGGEGAWRAHTEKATHSTDFVLQWGNRKRLRCMKIQVKKDSTTERTRVRVDRGVFRANRDPSNNKNNNNNNNNNNNLRRHFSFPPLPLPHRISRNCEAAGAMKGQSNGVVNGNSCSPERGREEKAQDKKNNNANVGASVSSETAQDSKKGGGGSSSGSDSIAVWLPKFVIALTNKEKEEDFMAIKGSKLPQRPKKRAKFVQRTLNFVTPGSLLCDLTLERYEVREKKISKKRPRGLKAMGNIESDSD